MEDGDDGGGYDSGWGDDAGECDLENNNNTSCEAVNNETCDSGIIDTCDTGNNTCIDIDVPENDYCGCQDHKDQSWSNGKPHCTIMDTLFVLIMLGTLTLVLFAISVKHDKPGVEERGFLPRGY